jgi:hypothetical protein
VKTNFGGSLPKEVCPLLDPSTMSFLTLITYVSIGRVFGGLRFLRGQPFWLGRQLKGRFVLWII